MLVLVLAGCAGPAPTQAPMASPSPDATRFAGATQSAAATDAVEATPRPEATTVASVAASAAPEATASQTFTNPVIDADFPDPFVTAFEGLYYGYATGSSGRLIQVATSPDLVTWTQPREALMREPRWMAGSTWAPEVYALTGGYRMYYSGRTAIERPNGEGAPCISVAVADDPGGPFVDESEEPLVCQAELGGSIDPTVFIANNHTPYLIWKNDGNCCAIRTRFYMQELSDDGLSLVGDEPVDLGVEDDEVWEGGVIEAPTLHQAGTTYHLFYSGNVYDTHRYAVGYATSDKLSGPYTDAPENPILTFEAPAVAVGPGHQSIVADDEGDLWMAYHAWDVNAIGYALGGRRALWIDRLVFEDGEPRVLGPNASPQPVP